MERDGTNGLELLYWDSESEMRCKGGKGVVLDVQVPSIYAGKKGEGWKRPDIRI